MTTRQALFGNLSAVFIAGTAYAFALSGGSFRWMVISQALLLALPVLVMAFNDGCRNFHPTSLYLSLLFALILIANLLINSDNYSLADSDFVLAAFQALGFAALLILVQWVTANFQVERVLATLGLLLLPLLLLALRDSYAALSTGRPAPLGLHPNWWGELALAAVGCLIALRSPRARLVALSVPLALAVLVQSRSGLAGALACIGTFYLYSAWSRLRYRKAAWLTAGLAVMAVTFLLFTLRERILPVIRFIGSSILLLDDPYRGLGTGLTGRITEWQEAATLFQENPLLGFGIGTLTSVHNGYLRLAGEGGLLLVTFVTVLMLIALGGAIRSGNRVAASLLVGYAVYVAFQPRMLNMNIASILFLFGLFPWRATARFRAQGIHGSASVGPVHRFVRQPSE